MQSAVLAVAFSLSAMGCHHGSACRGVMHRQACYSSCYSGGCYGGGCYGGGCYGGGGFGGAFGGRRMASFGGGYPQAWSSPGYAPMSYSGGGYSGYSGQMAGYSPMYSGYATPMVGNSMYGATGRELWHPWHDGPRHYDVFVCVRQAVDGYVRQCGTRADGSGELGPGNDGSQSTRSG